MTLKSDLPPIVSVIMSMRNSASTVGAAVRSVLMQTLRDWEMIVIDDGSSDQSSAIVEGFQDGRIRLIRESRSAGLAARLNQAVALSQGEFIARMDADDICFPERLARQVARLREDPRLDLLGCGAVVFTSDGNLIGEMPVGLDHQDIVARPFVGFPLPHPTWCGRASWFRNNPYNAELRYAEDQDLLLRSFRHSRLGGLDKVLLGYRQDRLALKKLIPGRATFARSAWRNGLATGELLPALAGIANHAAKGMTDVATLALGLDRQMQLRRLKPVSPAVAREWQQLQEVSGCFFHRPERERGLMCGIAGLFRPGGGEESQLSAIARHMTDALAYRGPDAVGLLDQCCRRRCFRPSPAFRSRPVAGRQPADAQRLRPVHGDVQRRNLQSSRYQSRARSRRQPRRTGADIPTRRLCSAPSGTGAWKPRCSAFPACLRLRCGTSGSGR